MSLNFLSQLSLQVHLKDSIGRYLKSTSTDYTIMLNGEWGSGKTYFIKNKIFDLIKDNGQRAIYVSLTGIDSEECLEKKIFKYINPFYITSKSGIAKEADYLESVVNGDRDERSIPKNIVLILDDLERLDSQFLQTALGYINIFIEHYKIKCIFICNEGEINNPNYKKVKEKYIQL